MRWRRTSVLSLGLAAALLATPVWAQVIGGTPGDDVLVGTVRDDRVDAGDGADTVSGRAGSDRLYGEGGDDLLHGDAGGDLLSGGVGADHLHGGYGADRMELLGSDVAHGGPQDDVASGAGGDYRVRGGYGADELHAFGPGVQVLHGDAGDDVLEFETQLGTDGRAYGGPGDDYVAAEPGSLRVVGRASLLAGGAGDDLVFGAAAVLDGGAGNDHVSGYAYPGARVELRCGGGYDTAEASDRTLEISADCEHVTILIQAAVGEAVLGTEHHDRVFDATGDETISTLTGNDQVLSGRGSDTVDLGPGDDVFYSDWLQPRPGDVDTITCGSGEDRVFAQTQDVVAHDCEHVG